MKPITSSLVLVAVGVCLVGAALGSPAAAAAGQQQEQQHISEATGSSLARAFKDILNPASTTNLTKGIIDSTLSVLGVFAFTMAFIIIPVLALLYTSGLNWPLHARSLSKKSDKSSAHIRLARGILDSDRCIERIVCEVTKGTRNSRAERWADAVFSNFPSEGKIMRRISETYRGRQAADCSAYSCEPVGFVVRLFIYATDWNTVLKG